MVCAGFPRGSISYNRWTEPLERAAAALPASAWTAVSPDGHYAYVRHQPEGCTEPQVNSVRRWRGEGELFERHAFCACEGGTRAPRAVWDRHDLKGERERLFAQLLSDLDLHHPPCLALAANQAFYTLAVLAYNVLTARTAHRPLRLARAHAHPAPADPAGQTLAPRPRPGPAAILSGHASDLVAAVARTPHAA